MQKAFSSLPVILNACLSPAAGSQHMLEDTGSVGAIILVKALGLIGAKGDSSDSVAKAQGELQDRLPRCSPLQLLMAKGDKPSPAVGQSHRIHKPS